ncbi:MAG: acyl-CoA dehydrogenase [Chloroflexota bacterium]|nr:MAG: acyl-CoA dehydrogenase [Chloroflexota bacterium]
MIGFDLTEEQKMLQRLVADMMERTCPRDKVREMDEQEVYPRELYQEMARVGLLGLPFPEQYGGTNGSMLDVAIILEALAKRWTAAAEIYILSISNVGRFILRFGTPEQLDYYLPRLIHGEITFCLALTEPNAGSDLASLTTRAVADGDHFIVNGAKIFSTQAHQADWMFAAVRTTKGEKKHQGITMMLIDAKSPGIEIRPIKKLGQKAVATCEVSFTDVYVPRSCVLGEVDNGWNILKHHFEMGRVGTAAVATGIAQAALDDAVAYAKERVQFDQYIKEFQSIQHILADMAMRIHASRLMTHYAAWHIDQRIPCLKEAAMAKTTATDTAMWCTTNGIQVLGGYGYTMEFDMQRYFRDCKILQIAGGSNQIQRNIIARML